MMAVVGFAFDPTLERVLLIEKNRPEWQKGYLNGPGGKIEPGETPVEAMQREFREETGIDHPDWEHYATLVADGVSIWCFRAILNIDAAGQTTDERLVRAFPDKMMANPKVMHNLRWLIPMAMFDTPKVPVEFQISFLPNDWRFS